MTTPNEQQLKIEVERQRWEQLTAEALIALNALYEMQTEFRKKFSELTRSDAEAETKKAHMLNELDDLDLDYAIDVVKGAKQIKVEELY